MKTIFIFNLVGGGSITTGYYKNPEKTAEDYFTDNSGRRWFKSGDIGQVISQFYPSFIPVLSQFYPSSTLVSAILV